jgi:hypothetical protein
MKLVWKSRMSFRPNVEMLESRMQPGSILTGGMGLSMLADSLDLGSLTSPSQSPLHRRLTDSDTSLIQLDQGFSGGPGSTAPGASTRVLSPAQQTGSLPANGSGLSINQQALALNGHHAGNPVSSTMGRAAQARPQVATAVPHAETTSAVNSGAGTHITTSQLGGGIGNFAMLNWASYLGQAGASLNRVVAGGDGNLYAVGTIPDASNGGTDVLVAQVSHDGNTINLAAISYAGSTFNTGNAIAVDTSGSHIITYLAGTTDLNQGVTTYIFARYDFTAGAVNWTVSPATTDRGGAINGLALTADNQTLYASGWENASFEMFPPQSLLTFQFTDLANSTPTRVAGYVWNYQNFDNDPGTSLSLQASGLMDISQNFFDPTDTVSHPGVGEYNLSGAGSGSAFIFNTIVGSMNDVIVGIGGTIDSVGTVTDANSGLTDLFVVNGSFANGGATGYSYPGSNGANLTGNAIGAFTDLFGGLTPVVAGTTDNGNGNVDMLGAKFSSDFSMMTDSTTIGGSGTDVANGVTTDTNGNAYVVGTTNSPDFPVTMGPTYGGDPSDGVVLSLGAWN